MLNPTARHIRRSSWAVTGLEAGAVLFAGGITLLYLNPFWHFDESGFLDWRVHWWNAAGEVLIAAGLLTEALALLASVAVIVSRAAGRRSWPYALAALLVFCAVVWVIPSGFVHDVDAHFEWNTADGFSVSGCKSGTQALEPGVPWIIQHCGGWLKSSYSRCYEAISGSTTGRK